ncbi:MAG: RNA polymerase sigma factor [Fimbriiglobus sp.]
MNWRLLQQTLPDAREISDVELLRRFTAQADHIAFAALVQRHGRLVWSVCRSRCWREADAEDAFQATFLALLRAAPTLRLEGSIGPWLWTTAQRVVNKSLVSAARRAKREAHVAASEADQRPTERDWERTTATLHEELAQLSETLRTAYVVCVLEGASVEVAAQQLGCTPGTLATRLTRAKQQLERRLSDRGLVPIVVAGLSLGSSVLARVPEQLLTQTLSLTTGATIPTTILTLLPEGTMLLKWKLLAATLILITGLGTTTTLWQGHADEPKPKTPPAAAKTNNDELKEAQKRIAELEVRVFHLLEQLSISNDAQKNGNEAEKKKPMTQREFLYHELNTPFKIEDFEKVVSTRAGGKIPAEYDFVGSVCTDATQPLHPIAGNSVLGNGAIIVPTGPDSVATIKNILIFRRRPSEPKVESEKLANYVAQGGNILKNQASQEKTADEDLVILKKLIAQKDDVRTIYYDDLDLPLATHEFQDVLDQCGSEKFKTAWRVKFYIDDSQFDKNRARLTKIIYNGPKEQMDWVEALVEKLKKKPAGK